MVIWKHSWRTICPRATTRRMVRWYRVPKEGHRAQSPFSKPFVTRMVPNHEQTQCTKNGELAASPGTGGGAHHGGTRYSGLSHSEAQSGGAHGRCRHGGGAAAECGDRGGARRVSTPVWRRVPR